VRYYGIEDEERRIIRVIFPRRQRIGKCCVPHLTMSLDSYTNLKWPEYHNCNLSNTRHENSYAQDVSKVFQCLQTKIRAHRLDCQVSAYTRFLE